MSNVLSLFVRFHVAKTVYCPLCSMFICSSQVQPLCFYLPNTVCTILLYFFLSYTGSKLQSVNASLRVSFVESRWTILLSPIAYKNPCHKNLENSLSEHSSSLFS